jgi:septal ring factor EnvC (AmiA/AmiB activator)
LLVDLARAAEKQYDLFEDLMQKLVCAVAAVLFVAGTVTTATAGSYPDKKHRKTFHADNTAVKPAKFAKPAKPPKFAKAAKPAKLLQDDKATFKNQRTAVKEDIKREKRDLKQDQARLKRLRKDLKNAERVGDTVRIARDREAIRRLEADMRADRADIRDDKADAKAGGKYPKKPK